MNDLPEDPQDTEVSITYEDISYSMSLFALPPNWDRDPEAPYARKIYSKKLLGEDPVTHNALRDLCLAQLEAGMDAGAGLDTRYICAVHIRIRMERGQVSDMSKEFAYIPFIAGQGRVDANLLPAEVSARIIDTLLSINGG